MTDFRATPETPDNGTGEAITMRLQLPMGPTVEEFWETMHEQMLNCAFMLSYGCKIAVGQDWRGVGGGTRRAVYAGVPGASQRD